MNMFVVLILLLMFFSGTILDLFIANSLFVIFYNTRKLQLRRGGCVLKGQVLYIFSDYFCLFVQFPLVFFCFLLGGSSSAEFSFVPLLVLTTSASTPRFVQLLAFESHV